MYIQLCAVLLNLAPGKGHEHHVPSFTSGQLPGIPTAALLAGESRASLSQEADSVKLMIVITDLYKIYETLVSWYIGPGSDNLMHSLHMDSKLGKTGKGGQEGNILSFPS